MSTEKINNELGVLIKATQTILNQRMDERLRPLGLTVPQYACLQNLLQEPGITSSELARRTFISRQSMNVLLQGLEKKNLVERARELGKNRDRKTALTPAAIKLLDQVRPEIDAVVGQMTSNFDLSERKQLCNLLNKCKESLTSTIDPTSTSH